MNTQYYGMVTTSTAYDPRRTALIVDQIEVIAAALECGYDSSYAALAAPLDRMAQSSSEQCAERMLALKPTMLVLIGIGGSNMGTLALVHALRGTLFNETDSGIKFYCADTIDNDAQRALLERVERELKDGGTVILCIVTKSGTTTETIINAALFIDLLKKYRAADYKKQVVVLTDADSPLMKVAQEQEFEILPIEKNVGGRFSIFTAVGLFPLALLGLNGHALCQGAVDMLDVCLKLDLENNPAAQSAFMLFNHYQKGYTVHNIFVFSPDLMMVGNWYKQLIGESLGKKYDNQHELVARGFTPVVSVGTVDLHSVVQLYLSGPQNIITSFVEFAKESEALAVPDNAISAIIPGLAHRSITFTKKALFYGVTEAYKNEERPFMVTTLADKSTYELGQFMMLKMIETLFLAKLWDINPFDQPAVEVYKKHARMMMGS